MNKNEKNIVNYFQPEDIRNETNRFWGNKYHTLWYRAEEQQSRIKIKIKLHKAFIKRKNETKHTNFQGYIPLSIRTCRHSTSPQWAAAWRAVRFSESWIK